MTELEILRKEKLDLLNWLKSELRTEENVKLDKPKSERARFLRKIISKIG